MAGPETILRGKDTLRATTESVPIRATVLLNPTAGEGEWPADRIGAALQEAGFAPDVTDIKATDPGRAIMAPTDLYIIAGGDGTVAEIAPLLPRRARFAILPLGTANNVASAHGLPDDPGWIIPRLAEAPDRGFPMLQLETVQDRQVLTDALGLQALAASLELAEEGKTGAEKIAEGRRAFAQALFEAKPCSLRCEINGRTEERETLMFEVLAHGRTGPALQLLEEPVCPGEIGLFTVMPEQLEPMRRWLKAGAEGPAPGLIETARELRLSWDGALPLRCDDELRENSGASSGLKVRGFDPDLRLLVPKRGENA
ncbi:MAG: diacylglycerol/lipid kinase family protein [Limimaricola soesokkakensis]|uniref:diacylglycerol/lipid kinase family protein n=1 Tax=Limimaricola soesokkakensis TaxID=1343159 RepID=UPI0040587ED7